MKALICGLFMALSALTASAQKSPVKFGNIPMEDMKMTVYDKDSSAAAVILVDYGEAYIQVNTVSVTLNFERHVRIKILKKEGLEFGDVSVPLHVSGTAEEKVTNLKAVTYTLENGQITETKMGKDAIFKEKLSKYKTLHKFTLPNVKEGSVIEYSFTIMSDFITYFPNWQFQYTIPVRHSEFWASIPEYFSYEKYMQGYVQVNKYEVIPKNSVDFQVNAHHWIVQNVPAFKEEPLMTSEEDYLSRINFALARISLPRQPVQDVMGSWQKLNDVLVESESFGGIIKSSVFLKKQATDITTGMTDPLQKATAIYNFVKDNLEWDGDKDYLSAPPRKVFDSKKGSAGDINIILASMLEKVDIDVDMVILSTRDHGFVRKEYPMSKQFNYAVCLARIGDKEILMDATEKLLPMGVLPERCLNGEGLVISKTKHGWIKLNPKVKARTVVSGDFALDAKGELKGNLSYTRDGYDAHKMRKEYQKKGEEEYLKDFLSTKTWQVDKSNFENIKTIDQSAKQVHSLVVNENVSVAGDVMYVNPFVTSQIQENPFKLETREYPVDYGSNQESTYLCKFTLPEGFAVDEMPKSKILLLPGGAAKYSYNCSQVGNTVTIVSTFQINKSLFLQNEYPDLREFYNQVVAKQAEQIVLKKK
jgi:hypothetical protein